MMHCKLMLPLLAAAALTGCDRGPKSGKGFHLPEGDPEKGKAAFVELKCHTCHTVTGMDLPPLGNTIPKPVVIGGEVVKVKTYGELVTAIVHPSHNLSPQLQKEWMGNSELSPMGSFNHAMTVEQLIDLLAFLQPRYRELEPLRYGP